jgi:hypothetical protein
MKAFTLFNNRGVQFTFENGYTLSIMFGEHNYCDSFPTEGGIEAEEAEYAVLYKKRFVTRGLLAAMKLSIPNDDVCGPCNVSEVMQVAEFLNDLNDLEAGSEIDNFIYNYPKMGEVR